MFSSFLSSDVLTLSPRRETLYLWDCFFFNGDFADFSHHKCRWFWTVQHSIAWLWNSNVNRIIHASPLHIMQQLHNHCLNIALGSSSRFSKSHPPTLLQVLICCMQLWQKFPPISTEDKALKFGFSQLSNARLSTRALETAWWDLGGFLIGLCGWFCLVYIFFFVVVCWKEQKWQNQSSFPQFLPASERVWVFYSKHKWKCSCPKLISRLCHSEMERGKQGDHCCLFSASHSQTSLLATALIILLLF